MSMNLVNKTTGDLTPIAGNATDKVGDLSALTTTDKSSVVGAINEVNDFAKSMIAPSTLLTSSDDLNSVLTAGVYRTEGTSVPAHAIGNNHIIWVIKQGATNYTRYLQVTYSFNTKEMYFRQTTDAGSTWSNWTLISSEERIDSLALRSDATAVNLFNNAKVTKWGKLVIVDFEIRLSSVPSSDLVICDYVFPTSKSGLRVTGQVTPENASAKGLAVRIDAGTHKLTIKGGDTNVVYMVRLVYLTA